MAMTTTPMGTSAAPSGSVRGRRRRPAVRERCARQQQADAGDGGAATVSHGNTTNDGCERDRSDDAEHLHWRYARSLPRLSCQPALNSVAHRPAPGTAGWRMCPRFSSTKRVAASMIASWSNVFALELPGHTPVAQDVDAVADGDQFGHLARHQQERRAFASQLADQLIDLSLGSDVDAARRLIEQEERRSRSAGTCR